MVRTIIIGILGIALCIKSNNVYAQEVTHSSFEEMLIYVYQNNPQLESERRSLEIADEKVSQAVAGYRPTVSANGAAGRQRESTAGTEWLYGAATAGSVNAVQPLFNGFGTLAQRRAADQRVLAARAHLLAVEQNVFLSAISGWLDICEKEKILSLTQDNAHNMQTYLDATSQRFKAGDGTKTDVSQAESRLAQAEARLATALAERDSAQAAFARITGMMAATVEYPLPPQGLPKDAEEAQMLARNTPELTQVSYQEKAAEQDIKAAESSLWPNISLQASTSEQNSPSLGLARLRDDSVTLNVTIPLYQGGAEYSRVREAHLVHEKSRYDAIDTDREVVERARFSWNSYYAAQAVIAASSRASVASAQALSGVQEEQRQGMRTLTEVLDEQLQLLGSQVSEVQAQKNFRLEAYRLLASTGRLTTEGLNLQVQRHDVQAHYDDTTSRWIGF